MADLIDRKEILRVIQNFDFHICCARATGKYKTSLEKYKMYRAIREQFLLLIKGIPKADTERHAHWGIWDEDTNTYECSNCKNPFTLLEGTPKQNTYFYCPNCGCKMDEVQE